MHHEQADETAADVSGRGHHLDGARELFVGDTRLDHRMIRQAVELAFNERLSHRRVPLVKNPELDKLDLTPVRSEATPLTNLDLDVSGSRLRPDTALEP